MAILAKSIVTGSVQTAVHARTWYQYQSPRPKDYAKINLPIVRRRDQSLHWESDRAPYPNSCLVTYWGRRSGFDSEFQGIIGEGTTWTVPTGPHARQAYNAAYAKFLGKAYKASELATTLAERRKSMSMLTSRLIQIHRAAAALKRGRFKKFVQVLGVQPRWKDRSKAWARPKQFSSLWLEYWFGWAPLIGDIYLSLENQLTVIPRSKIRAGASVPYEFFRRQSSNYGRDWGETHETGKIRCLITGYVDVVDEHLHNRQKLGLMNPFRTALDLIPFSWLANWFVNLQQIVGSLTDFAGLKLSGATVSFKYDVTEQFRGALSGSWNYINYLRRRQYYARKNVTGSSLPKPKLTVRFAGLSPTRAATAIALIINQFAPGKKQAWSAYYHQ